MKNRILIIFLLMIVMLSCKNDKINVATDETEILHDNILDSLDVKKKVLEDLGEVKDTIIRIFYVDALSGLNVRSQDGVIIGKLSNGEAVIVLDYTSDFVEVIDEGVKLKARKAIIKYKDTIGYVFGGFLVDKIKGKQPLIDVFEYHKSDNSTISKNNIVSIDLVNETQYNSYSFFNKNFYDKTDNFKKVDSIIYLDTDYGVKKLVERYNSEDMNARYQFLGESKELNAYVLEGTYWEWMGTSIVSKSYDKEIIVGENPSISPDNNYIVSFYRDLGEENTNIIVKKKSPDFYGDFLVFTLLNYTSLDFNIRWIEEDTFLMETISYDFDFSDDEEDKPNNRKYYLKIKINDE